MTTEITYQQFCKLGALGNLECSMRYSRKEQRTRYFYCGMRTDVVPLQPLTPLTPASMASIPLSKARKSIPPKLSPTERKDLAAMRVEIKATVKAYEALLEQSFKLAISMGHYSPDFRQ